MGACAIHVANPVGRHEPSELRQELSEEGVVAAEALRLGDKAEQPLRIASRECRHRSSKDTSNVVWTPVTESGTVGGVRIPSRLKPA
jgi:hypothetical protein